MRIFGKLYPKRSLYDTIFQRPDYSLRQRARHKDVFGMETRKSAPTQRLNSQHSAHRVSSAVAESAQIKRFNLASRLPLTHIEVSMAVILIINAVIKQAPDARSTRVPCFKILY